MSSSETTVQKGNAPEVTATEALIEANHLPEESNMSNSTVAPANSQPVFNFGENQVRLVVRDGEPWFAAADVCAVLAIKNHRESVRHLDEDEKGVISNDTPGGKQEISVVNESGLYALILRSRKPEAKVFTKWVTKEVLPSIRKTGQYQQPVAQGNQAIDHLRISPAQAQDLKQIVQAIVDAGIQSYGETWKRLQNKFRVNSYLQLPSNRYEEVRKYLIAKLPMGYVGEVVDDEPASAMNLDDAVRLDLAFSMSAQAGAQVQRSVFASVMQGDADWTCKRYISNLTYDRMTNRLTAPATRVMDHGEMVTTLDKLPDWINGNDPIFASDEQLANIATACTMRLSRSAANRRPSLGQ